MKKNVDPDDKSGSFPGQTKGDPSHWHQFKLVNLNQPGEQFNEMVHEEVDALQSRLKDLEVNAHPEYSGKSRRPSVTLTPVLSPSQFLFNTDSHNEESETKSSEISPTSRWMRGPYVSEFFRENFYHSGLEESLMAMNAASEARRSNSSSPRSKSASSSSKSDSPTFSKPASPSPTFRQRFPFYKASDLTTEEVEALKEEVSLLRRENDLLRKNQLRMQAQVDEVLKRLSALEQRQGESHDSPTIR